jgi:hypothetical protein
MEDMNEATLSIFEDHVLKALESCENKLLALSDRSKKLHESTELINELPKKLTSKILGI